MQAVHFDGKAVAYTTDYPKPQPAPGESLIRVLLAAVCNTDKEVARGYKPDFTGVMGHEFVGIVEESDCPELLGKRVVGELNAGCGRCIYCKTGREKHCVDRRVIGMAGKDGCFAQYMTLRSDLLHPVPDELPTELAIFTEPLAAAVQLLEQVHLAPSNQVAVIGDGRLAFLCAQVLALNGAAVTVFGRHQDKLAGFSGFAATATAPSGSFEVVVEASGSPSGLQDAAKLVRSGGTILLKSTYAGEITLNMSRFVVDEITVVGSRCGPFAPALRLLSRGLVTLPSIRLYPLEQYQEAFASTAFKAGFSIEKE